MISGKMGTRALVVAALVVALAMTGVAARSLAFVPRPAAAAVTDDPNYRTISVTGQGQVTVAPTICRLVVGVISDGNTAQRAQAANDAATDAVAAALRGLGIQPKDLQTVGFSLQPIYSEPPKEGREPFVPQVVGYRSIHRIQVTVRQLELVGKVIDEAIRFGANSAEDIVYAVEETDELRTQALAAAVRQARQKADAIAAAAGLHIVEIRQIQEHFVDFGSYRAPMAFDRAMGISAEASMPVLPGELVIRATVGMVCRY